MPDDPLAALGHIERCYDGPIAERLLLLARHGSGRAVRRLQASAQARFFAEMARRQVHAIRQRRADGSVYAAMIEDLAYYRRERQRWRRIARLFCGQNKAESPAESVGM